MAFAPDLKGKVALVTGGSRGIGAETVRLLRAAGARVAFSYRKARAQAEALAAECGGTDTAGEPQCIAIEQELYTPGDGRKLVENAVAAMGRLDILVANHGVDAASTAGQETGAATSGGAEPGTARGHIVLISSTAGQRGEAYHADYAVTKGALISLTKSLSTELAPQGIRVNCVAPGWVATDMTAATLADPATGEKIAAAIPLGRVATAREIAGPIVFLCTPLAGFISGEVLNVNGGAVLVG